MPVSFLALVLLGQAPQLELGPGGDTPIQRFEKLSSADVRALRPALGAAQASDHTGEQYGLTAVPTSVAPDGDSPSGLAYTVDGSRYLIAHRDSRNVMVFDASTDALVQAVELSGSPLDLAISPNGLWAATANGVEDSVSLIDLGTLTEVAVIGVGPVPGSLAFTTDSAKVACINAADDSLSVIDVGTASATQTVQLGGLVSSASLSSLSGGSVYSGPELLCVDEVTAVVPYYFDGQVAFVDLTTGSVNAVDTDAEPRGMAFTAQAGRLVVAHTTFSRTVSVFDTASQAIDHTFEANVPAGLRGPISIRPNGVRGAVSSFNLAYVVNFDTGALGPPLQTGLIDELHSTTDGLFALGVGTHASLISYNSQTLVTLLVEQAHVTKGAVSPVTSEAVMTGSLVDEDVLRVETENAASGLIHRQSTGVSPEGDHPRLLAISDDGALAVATNYLSDTASVVNLSTGELLGVVPVGDRPTGVAITPDASQAVVASNNSAFVTVIDLKTLEATEVPISTWGSEVVISPDSQYAYVSVLSNGPGVWRIDLNTLQAAGGKLSTGDMSSLPGPYFKASGIALSPDGSVLVTCDSFSSGITLIDTASWSVLSKEPVSDLQISIRAAFVPGTGRFVVALTKPPGLRVFELTPDGADAIASVSLGFEPYSLAVDSAGLFAYAGGSSPTDQLTVIDLSNTTVAGRVALPGRPIEIKYDAAGGALDVLCSESSLAFGGSVGFAIDNSSQWVRVDPNTLEIVGQTVAGLAGSDLVAGGNRLAGTAILRDLVLYGPREAALQADTLEVSASSGGTQNLSLELGPSMANKPYLILGTANGIAPGVTVDGLSLPLTLDAYLLQTIAQANSGMYHNTLGVLDADGRASAFLRVPPQSVMDFIGLQLNHVGVVLDPIPPKLIAATNPVLLTIAP